MYYVIYKNSWSYLSFFGDLYSKVLVICIIFYQVPNIIHVNYFIVFFFPHTFVLTQKYCPELFAGAFKLKHFIRPQFWHVNFHQIIPLHTCVGFCRVQITFEGFQHLELVMVALVQVMWLKIT
jgi:hypothetical protein